MTLDIYRGHKTTVQQQQQSVMRQNNTENLDPSYQTALDLMDCWEGLN